MLHDPDNYPDPFAFKPERYLKDGHWNKDVLDPFTNAGFGFGRRYAWASTQHDSSCAFDGDLCRICPGRHISIDSVYAMIVSTLAVFDIIAPKDEHGNITLKLETDGGMLAYVLSSVA